MRIILSHMVKGVVLTESMFSVMISYCLGISSDRVKLIMIHLQCALVTDVKPIDGF